MAKRYHQSRKDRRDESRGEKRYLDAVPRTHADSFNDEFHHNYERDISFRQGDYAGVDARRRQEMQDAGMIREDHAAVANLPQGVVMRPYRMAGGYLPEGLDDTIRGVDEQMDYDGMKRRQHFMPKKV